MSAIFHTENYHSIALVRWYDRNSGITMQCLDNLYLWLQIVSRSLETFQIPDYFLSGFPPQFRQVEHK
jgi:hypothetical protein